MTYASPEIDGVDGATISVEASPDNDEFPLVMKQCVVVIRRDGKISTVRLGVEAAAHLSAALAESLSEHPGEVVKL